MESRAPETELDSTITGVVVETLINFYVSFMQGLRSLTLLSMA